MFLPVMLLALATGVMGIIRYPDHEQEVWPVNLAWYSETSSDNKTYFYMKMSIENVPTT